jgi:hypothetical protein
MEAPAVTGHPIFERHFRVAEHVEQLVVFFPSLFLFQHFVSSDAAAVLGLIFVAGRVLYAIGYVKDPTRRGPGFMLSALANEGLGLGALIGSARALLG